MTTTINGVKTLQIKNAKNGDFDLNFDSGSDETPFYPVLVTTGNSYLTWQVSNYTHGTCRTHIEVNGKLCPIFVVKLGSKEWEVLQIEKANGQPLTYAYYRLTRDESQNITKIELIKFELLFNDVQGLQANETVYKRTDGGKLRAYYYDYATSSYKWIGSVSSPSKYVVGHHTDFPFYVYAKYSADQFYQITNLDSSAKTLSRYNYDVDAIIF